MQRERFELVCGTFTSRATCGMDRCVKFNQRSKRFIADSDFNSISNFTQR